MSQETPVKDKTADLGIIVGNVINAMVLSVMAWVGVSISNIKENVSDIKINQSVALEKITALEKQIDNNSTLIDRNTQAINKHLIQHP